MVYEQDYILRQIEILMQGIRRVFFGKREKGAAAFAVSGALPGALWYTRVLERLEAGDINGAENLLFALMDPAEPRSCWPALDFYNRLRRIPEALPAGERLLPGRGRAGAPGRRRPLRPGPWRPNLNRRLADAAAMRYNEGNPKKTNRGYRTCRFP